MTRQVPNFLTFAWQFNIPPKTEKESKKVVGFLKAESLTLAQKPDTVY